MPPMIQFPLDLPEVRVLGTDITNTGDVLIGVESILVDTTYRRCGHHIRDFHGHDRPLRLRHLPILDQRVFIKE